MGNRYFQTITPSSRAISAKTYSRLKETYGVVHVGSRSSALDARRWTISCVMYAISTRWKIPSQSINFSSKSFNLSDCVAPILLLLATNRLPYLM